MTRAEAIDKLIQLAKLFGPFSTATAALDKAVGALKEQADVETGDPQYINKNAAIYLAEKYGAQDDPSLNPQGRMSDVIISRLRAMPAADVEPVRRGKWQFMWHDDIMGTSVQCPLCGGSGDGDDKYCPQCGAKLTPYWSKEGT